MSQQPDAPFLQTRRRFLQSTTAIGGGALAFAALGVKPALSQQAILPPPDASGIEHIVVLMMENRSFDNMLGHLSMKRFGNRNDVAGLTEPESNLDYT